MGPEILAVITEADAMNGMRHIYAVVLQIVKHVLDLNVHLNTTEIAL